MNLEELCSVTDKLRGLSIENSKDPKDIEIEFETFDANFEINSDEFQRPKDITKVYLDVLNLNKAIIRIETPDRLEEESDD